MKTLRNLLVLGCCLKGFAADRTPEIKKTPIRPTLSVTLSERYDSNVMLQNRGALDHTESWVTSVQPVIGVTVPWKGDWPGSVGFQYAPDFTFFHDRDEESYLRHTGVVRLEAKGDRLRASATIRPQYTDGSTEGPIWGTVEDPGTFPALGAPEVRYRRRNFYWQSPLEARYDGQRWYARGVFNARIWDIMTEGRVVPGAVYQNYMDRTDVVGGPEAGFKVSPGWEAGVGYRFGHQDHEQNPYAEPYTYQNDYHRVVGVLSANLLPGVKLTGEAGPSVHQFNPSSAAPGTAVQETLLYYSVNLNARLATNTQLRAQSYLQFLPSTAGRAGFQNFALTGSLEQRWTAKLKTALSCEIQEYNMIRGLKTWDRVFKAEARVEYVFHRRCSAETWYAREWADNLEPGTSAREYDRHIAGLGVKVTY
ncbi:MAG: outer membrane beta-barrel protein [Verrucomicrobia bacterium]|nr:outer membrane beta-barrel protein [Verrucomicrobiota bacterium]